MPRCREEVRSIAYLVNRYPDYSHSFIRREILELERRGIRIRRFSSRPPHDGLADPADRHEADLVHVILRVGWGTLARDVIHAAGTRPRRFARAAARAFGFWRRARRRPVAHLAYFVEACHLARQLADHPVDILHAHFGTNPATVALLTRVLGGPPVVITVHGPEEFEDADRLSLADKVRGAAAIVAVCEHGAGRLRQLCGTDEAATIHVVHCAVDAEHLDGPAPALPTAPQIICVGRMAGQKDHYRLLEAMSILSARGVAFSLTLAGDGPLRPGLERLAASRGLSAHVTFCGWLSGSEIAAGLRQSRLLVLPSRAEGLPLVIMEAFAARRPVVATAVGGVPELVDASNGWLVPPGDTERLADAIAAALAAPDDTIVAMGQCGRKAIEEGYLAEHQAMRLGRVHEQVLATDRCAREPGAHS